jgi:hypothetical protein
VASFNISSIDNKTFGTCNLTKYCSAIMGVLELGTFGTFSGHAKRKNTHAGEEVFMFGVFIEFKS